MSYGGEAGVGYSTARGRDWPSVRQFSVFLENRVGVMLEVPSLLWQLDELLPRLDFISVGSNDLVQFLFAADRGNPRLAGRYDSLSPTALRVFDFIGQRARVYQADFRQVEYRSCALQQGGGFRRSLRDAFVRC